MDASSLTQGLVVAMVSPAVVLCFVIGTGRCDQYLFRCLADLYGYKRAQAIKACAYSATSVVEDIQREMDAVSQMRVDHPHATIEPRHWLLDTAAYSVLMDRDVPFYYNMSTGKSTWKMPFG